ncbi:MAG: hypothetical protein JWO79_3911 [Actinomycetia bacterium]|jgi:hypothetical protein|nr:hypothetical protein [Actinomycetes bacterium]MDQ1651826.1 hypothetical protein [Cryptosporangiaceae bacterium]
MSRILTECAGIAEAPLPEVRDTLFALVRQRNSGDGLTVLADARAGWIEVRGQWWYSGRYEVTERLGGTLVTHRVINLATGLSGRLVPFTVARGHRATAVAGLRALLTEVGTRLNCEIRPTPEVR